MEYLIGSNSILDDVTTGFAGSRGRYVVVQVCLHKYIGKTTGKAIPDFKAISSQKRGSSRQY